ncbi:N-acetyltransferase [Aminipila butyrica]|uniref:N-acetyltransferase n=1 Tax=Aminipila butyrica TaxID=433296 RepID=A0A858BYT5_9FIRM|nr:N-acetyltransferase [Aminipila butyrica]QIB70295.1 N-acetyltransferase [Aminipila butyrica]
MIRQATEEDFSAILDIYQRARQFMRETGNPTQWGDNHPAKDLLEDDIHQGQLYVFLEEDDIHGVFAFILGEDSTYTNIEQGSWKSAAPYGTIHRIAASGLIKGVFDQCITYCKTQCAHLRIDTHFDNQVMQHLIVKNGFEKRGIIYVEDGSPRLAYEYEGNADNKKNDFFK